MIDPPKPPASAHFFKRKNIDPNHHLLCVPCCFFQGCNCIHRSSHVFVDVDNMAGAFETRAAGGCGRHGRLDVWGPTQLDGWVVMVLGESCALYLNMVSYTYLFTQYLYRINMNFINCSHATWWTCRFGSSVKIQWQMKISLCEKNKNDSAQEMMLKTSPLAAYLP